MVDVGAKPATAREAVARGHITIAPDALALVRAGRIAKGDPLQAARLAGIMAAKRTSDLIPAVPPAAAHARGRRPAPDARPATRSRRRARTTAQTGVEMEALTAVSVAALTIYDMVKAVDRGMVIGEIRLIVQGRREDGDVETGGHNEERT